MNITLERSEILTGVETGAIEERYRFDGQGCIFSAGGAICEFPAFEIILYREANGALTDISLAAQSVTPATLAVLTQAVPIPVAAPDMAALHGANLMLTMKDAIRQTWVQPRLRGETDLGHLLSGMTDRGEPVFFELSHYDFADFAGY